LQALVAIGSGAYHLSKRTIVQMLSDWWNIPMSLGSVTAAEQAVSGALAGPVEEGRTYVESQRAASVDETGWRQGSCRAWLWVAATPWVIVFLVHARRSKEAALALLRTFRGIVGSDRWKAYRAWPIRRRQLCWAHLIRAFTGFEELGGGAARIGKALKAEARQMFTWWNRVRDGPLSRSSFQTYLVGVRRRVKILLARGARCRTPEVAATCQDLLKLFPALWTFVRVEGVEPTNNAAERAIRPGVLWRKGSFGTQSEEGSRFVERIMTTAATLRQQGRNVVDFVTQACEARLHGYKAPSLLPSHRLLRAAV
jgi:transposase